VAEWTTHWSPSVSASMRSRRIVAPSCQRRLDYLSDAESQGCEFRESTGSQPDVVHHRLEFERGF
jgi:hypothetical protein